MTLIDDIHGFAHGQHGVITTAQCLRLGATSPELVRLVREGDLLHPFRGAYAVPDAAGNDDPDHHHRMLCRAGLLVYPAGVLGGVSAIVAHGLPSTGADLSRPVIHVGPHRGVGIKGVRVRRARRTTPVDSELGATLPLAAALVDHARDHGTLAGVIAGDAALHCRAVSEEELKAAVASVRTWPRAAFAASALTFLDGRSESPGESWARFQLALSGIETVPQVDVRDEHGELVGRVDLLVTGTKIVVEFDGKVKYADGDGEVLWAEKRREDRLRRLGYTVIRVTWADLYRPGLIAASVRRALAAA